MHHSKGFWILAFVLMFGCTSIVLLSASSERSNAEVSSFKSRVKLLWDCRLRGDYVTVYDLMEPSLRESMSREQFVDSKGFLSYYSYEIQSIEMNGDQARTRVYYTWKANHPLFRKSKIREHVVEDVWTRVGTSWFKKVTSNLEAQVAGGAQVEERP